MRNVLKKILTKIFLDSEKDFLREQVRDLQMQVLCMADKNMEFVNAKIATSSLSQMPQAVNPETGLLEEQKPMTEEEKKQFELSKQELQDIFAH